MVRHGSAQVSIQYDNETITLLRSEKISGEEWQITAPVALAADGHNTRQFIGFSDVVTDRDVYCSMKNI